MKLTLIALKTFVDGLLQEGSGFTEDSMISIEDYNGSLSMFVFGKDSSDVAEFPLIHPPVGLADINEDEDDEEEFEEASRYQGCLDMEDDGPEDWSEPYY